MTHHDIHPFKQYGRLADFCDHNDLVLELATLDVGMELVVRDPAKRVRIREPFDIRNPDRAARFLLQRFGQPA